MIKLLPTVLRTIVESIFHLKICTLHEMATLFPLLHNYTEFFAYTLLSDTYPSAPTKFKYHAYSYY